MKEQTIGRWPSILAELGIETHGGKHGFCPVCGGVDRFRFDDKEGRGTWICSQHGAGDGFDLVMQVFGVDFKGAIEKVKPYIGCEPCRIVKEDPEKNRKWLLEVWSGCREVSQGDPVYSYLEGRGLKPPRNKSLFYCDKCYEASTKRRLPAMIAMVRGANGDPVTLHRTYLTKNGNGWVKANIESPKKLMKPVGKIVGGAIRLFDAKDVLGVAEGIETALACEKIFGIPTWAAVSSTIMAGFNPPEWIKHVIIYGDNDPNFTGQKAAYGLASRLEKSIQVTVSIPNQPGDWADGMAA